MKARLWAVLSISALVAAGCGGEHADHDSAAAREHPTDSSSGRETDTDHATDTDFGGLPDQLAAARLGTARYVTDLALAQADGYQVITPMMPDMGVHYLNPEITDFDPGRPPILVYVPTADGPQLGALEWVFPQEPEEPPLPGATYGEFAAACHFVDGTFVPRNEEATCAPTNPETGAAFAFWHGRLITLHVWLWFHNPDGLFAGMNPLVAPFNTDS